MIIIGIDLAWQSEKNTTALAVGNLHGNSLRIKKIYGSLSSLQCVIDVIEKESDVKGIAIDAPLIIPNISGQRLCEKELGKAYGGRKASCHTSNQTLYPSATSVSLSNHLSNLGFTHLSKDGSWQIECYPHPAIIEIFDLKERHKYKKGKVAEKRQGQIELAEYLKGLSHSNILKLELGGAVSEFTDTSLIKNKSGAQLKVNEDAIDSIICAYIGALYELEVQNTVFGGTDSGYIYVPQEKCI